MDNENVLLNIYDYQITETLGPGRRFALWVQGCPFDCKNCITPNAIPFTIKHPASVDHLSNIILEDKEIDGLTISGGEPFMQAGRLALLVKSIKKELPHLSVIVYTGFVLKQLTWEEAILFLEVIDVLIDGQYVDHKNDNKGLRGSSNQKVHFLTDTLLPHASFFNECTRDLTFHVRDDGVMMVGIPQKNFKW